MVIASVLLALWAVQAAPDVPVERMGSLPEIELTSGHILDSTHLTVSPDGAVIAQVRTDYRTDPKPGRLSSAETARLLAAIARIPNDLPGDGPPPIAQPGRFAEARVIVTVGGRTWWFRFGDAPHAAVRTLAEELRVVAERVLAGR